MGELVSSRGRWLDVAQGLRPVLHARAFAAQRAARPVRDARAWQGWRMEPAGEAAGRALGPEPLWLDFGRHLVGRFRIRCSGRLPAGARLLACFGEVPAEVCEAPEEYPGTLGGEWLKALPLEVGADGWAEGPPRRALQWARLWVEGGEPAGVAGAANALRLNAAEVVAMSSAGWDDPAPPASLEQWRRDLDRVAIDTLRSCMQGVFEDGPKRDRRLWLGDLYLQAKACYPTFGGHALVKRCLYLFAGTCGDDGLVSPCVFENPSWHGGHVLIPGYAWLFAPTLLDYLRGTDDRAAAADLFALALHQHTLFDRHVNAQGLFDPPAKAVWRFVDWSETLETQAAEQAIAVYSLNALLRLAPLVGRGELVAPLRERRDRVAGALRSALRDPALGLFRGEQGGQLSWATHA